jgi:hypothetical protein
MTETDEYLSPKQAMKLLGVSDGSINNWRNAGLLPYKLTPGGHYRYPKRAVLGLLRDPTENGRKGVRGKSLINTYELHRYSSRTVKAQIEGGFRSWAQGAVCISTRDESPTV